jgi:hypothetical protein
MRTSTATNKLQSTLIGQPDDLKGICYVLNAVEPAELYSELRRLVKAWRDSGPNLAKLLDADKALADRTRHGRTLLVPTTSGNGHLLWLPARPGFDPLGWKDHALAHFLDLVVNPQWHRLGGPCARCARYYIKKTKRQKAYCSRRCGSALTATEAVRKTRKAAHEDKLQRAQAALNSWATTRTRLPWKSWASCKTKITPKWLTRAVNKRQLTIPSKQ